MLWGQRSSIEHCRGAASSQVFAVCWSVKTRTANRAASCVAAAAREAALEASSTTCPPAPISSTTWWVLLLVRRTNTRAVLHQAWYSHLFIYLFYFILFKNRLCAAGNSSWADAGADARHHQQQVSSPNPGAGSGGRGGRTKARGVVLFSSLLWHFYSFFPFGSSHPFIFDARVWRFQVVTLPESLCRLMSSKSYHWCKYRPRPLPLPLLTPLAMSRLFHRESLKNLQWREWV